MEIQRGEKEEDKRFGTPMQWMWTKNRKEIRGVSTVKYLGIWHDIAGIKRRLEEGCRRRQKIKETSKPPKIDTVYYMDKIK